MTTPLTVQLAEAFGSKPVRKTLRQLVDELIEINIDGASSYESVQGQLELAKRAEAVDTEINRRLAVIEEFHQPESTQLRAILDGESEAWWQA